MLIRVNTTLRALYLFIHQFGVKIALAYRAYIEGKVVKAMESVVQSGAAGQGISGYIASGFSDANWIATARNIELANGGSSVYALGTKIALAKVLPDQTTVPGFKYDENSALVKTGYLPSYKEVPIIELGQALIPNTINGTPATVVSDKIIYMLPMAMYKPIHVVFEGGTVTVEKNPTEMADHTYTLNVSMRMGIGTVVGSKFGAIILP